jgi:hypothetical protein
MIAQVYSQIHIFDSDLFHGIEKSPEPYKNSDEYTYTEHIPDDRFLLKGPKVDLEIKVNNDEIEIHYFEINNSHHIQLVKIMKKTNINILGEYIGEPRNEVISTFGEPYIINNDEIIYYSQDFLIYVNFEIKNGIIKSITFGYSM